MKSHLVKTAALFKVDGASDCPVQTGVEQPLWVTQGSAFGEGQLDLVPVGFASANDAKARPDGNARRIRRLFPLGLFHDLRIGRQDQRSDTGQHVGPPIVGLRSRCPCWSHGKCPGESTPESSETANRRRLFRIAGPYAARFTKCQMTQVIRTRPAGHAQPKRFAIERFFCDSS